MEDYSREFSTQLAGILENGGGTVENYCKNQIRNFPELKDMSFHLEKIDSVPRKMKKRKEKGLIKAPKLQIFRVLGDKDKNLTTENKTVGSIQSIQMNQNDVQLLNSTTGS